MEEDKQKELEATQEKETTSYGITEAPKDHPANTDGKLKVIMEQEKLIYMASIDSEFEGLLNELTNNRKELDDMLITSTTFRKKIDTILPADTDFRKKYLIEEKMKLITSIFSIELDLRKQKESSIKNEIELRRKLSGAEKDDQELFADSIMLARALEKLEGKKIPKFENSNEENIVQIKQK